MSCGSPILVSLLLSISVLVPILYYPSHGWAEQSFEETYPGVRLSSQALDGPVRAWALEIDLCAPGVEVRATKKEESPQRTSAFGRSLQAQIAINGGFYEPDYGPTGFAAGAGQIWSDDIENHGFVGFGPQGAEIFAPRQLVEEPSMELTDAVGGYDQVVVAGKVPEFHQRFCRDRHPRTTVGLDKARRTLYLGVVDGRSEDSRGMTCAELGEWMAGLGAWDALNLDGGGSTTLWTETRGVVNRPSAGVERIVSNHLAIFASGEGPPSSCPEPWEEDQKPDELDGELGPGAWYFSSGPGSVDEDGVPIPGAGEDRDRTGEASSARRCTASDEAPPADWPLVFCLALYLLIRFSRSGRQRQVAGGH